MNAEDAELILGVKSRSKSRTRHSRGRATRLCRMENELGFRCRHCGFYVLADVRSRNHCPYCLWSRCLDLFEAGDRLSPCKAPMRPVGLAFKQTRKKYGADALGELMLVHQCTECGKASANRIAADDDPQAIFDCYLESLKLDQLQVDRIAAGGVKLVGGEHEISVRTQLFGKATLAEAYVRINDL